MICNALLCTSKVRKFKQLYHSIEVGTIQRCCYSCMILAFGYKIARFTIPVIDLSHHAPAIHNTQYYSHSCIARKPGMSTPFAWRMFLINSTNNSLATTYTETSTYDGVRMAAYTTVIYLRCCSSCRNCLS